MAKRWRIHAHDADQIAQLEVLGQAAKLAAKLGLRVSAGHGLNYHNVKPLTRILEIEEYNIGHSIISRAVFIGLERAVREMKTLIERPEQPENGH